MTHNIRTLFLFLFLLPAGFSQSVDAPLSHKKMKKDLETFIQIRREANSGLYKYRTPRETDSLYEWARNEIKHLNTFRDFFNLICHLTDFEGSLHNDTEMPQRYARQMRQETSGYFPYPVKWVDGNWIINYEGGELPLGSIILSINHRDMNEVISHLNPYYTTDGSNISGKRIGIDLSFGKYYRLYYGLQDHFEICYKPQGSDTVYTIDLPGVGYTDYYTKVARRYSRPFDSANYKQWKEHEKYTFQALDDSTAKLTINSFSMGNENSSRHLRYVSFLDSVFTFIGAHPIQHLIVDVRYNGGGSDPNDLVTYSYLTQRPFMENRQAWISFQKIPYPRHLRTSLPGLLKFITICKDNNMFQEEFPKEINGAFYEDEHNGDHLLRQPDEKAFTGKVYLLISPRVASAGSLFAAMVAGNENSITIGEETMGGYYGHNGHTSLEYMLPKSKLTLSFSVVNLEQDVPEQSNQLRNRGIIPDHSVPQSYEDYLNHTDTQLNFVLKMIGQQLR